MKWNFGVRIDLGQSLVTGGADNLSWARVKEEVMQPQACQDGLSVNAQPPSHFGYQHLNPEP
jgi:hypothetical protein